MTCVDVLDLLDGWPGVCNDPDWGDVVRHTWKCADCRAQLVAVVVLAERVRAAMDLLPDPPASIRVAVFGTGAAVGGAPRERPLRARLLWLETRLPPLLRAALDPMTALTSWTPAWLPGGIARNGSRPYPPAASRC